MEGIGDNIQVGENSKCKGGNPEKSLAVAESLQKRPAGEEVSLLEETGRSGGWALQWAKQGR